MNKLIPFLSVALTLLLIHFFLNRYLFSGINESVLLFFDVLIAGLMALWTLYALATKPESKINFVNRFLLLTSIQFLTALASLTFLAYTIKKERISLVIGVLLFFVVLMFFQSFILIKSSQQSGSKK